MMQVKAVTDAVAEYVRIDLIPKHPAACHELGTRVFPQLQLEGMAKEAFWYTRACCISDQAFNASSEQSFHQSNMQCEHVPPASKQAFNASSEWSFLLKRHAMRCFHISLPEEAMHLPEKEMRASEARACLVKGVRSHSSG